LRRALVKRLSRRLTFKNPKEKAAFVKKEKNPKTKQLPLKTKVSTICHGTTLTILEINIMLIIAKFFSTH
jgi:hypothetical protein